MKRIPIKAGEEIISYFLNSLLKSSSVEIPSGSVDSVSALLELEFLRRCWILADKPSDNGGIEPEIL